MSGDKNKSDQSAIIALLVLLSTGASVLLFAFGNQLPTVGKIVVIPFVVMGMALLIVGVLSVMLGALSLLVGNDDERSAAPTEQLDSNAEEQKKYRAKMDREREEKRQKQLRSMEQEARIKWRLWYHRKPAEEIDAMSGEEFERYIQVLLTKLGYTNLRLTRKSGDQGADLLGNSPDGKPVAIQTKRRKKFIGNSAVQELLGAITYYGCSAGIVVTNTGYTKSAMALAAKDRRIALWSRGSVLDAVEKVFPEIIPPFDWPRFFNEFVDSDTFAVQRWRQYRNHFLSDRNVPASY